MSSVLDMSLDDLIKNSKSSFGNNFRGRGRGRGRGSGSGPARRFPNRGANRVNPYSMGEPVQSQLLWHKDMLPDPMAAYSAQGGRGSAIETGTKLYISNLDYGVSNEDIKELFSEVGDLKRYSIHYDRSGRSKGTAEVVFSRRGDAMAAVKRYNNVQLDGKPMKIEIVGTNIATPAALPPVINGTFGHNTNVLPRSTGVQGRGGAIGRPRGGGGSRGTGRGRSRGGWGSGRNDPVSAEDLDAELDKYHSEAMQVN